MVNHHCSPPFGKFFSKHMKANLSIYTKNFKKTQCVFSNQTDMKQTLLDHGWFFGFGEQALD